jgi:hypothetical protein
VFFFLRKRSTSESDPSLSDSPGNTPGDSDPVLKRGSRGEEVKKLQRYLHGQLVLAPIYNKVWPTCNGKQLDSLAVDGIFGEKTECACEWWFGRTSVKLSEIPDTL